MPTFCRHNRLVTNCPICAREQEVELRPVISPSGPRPNPPRGAPSAGSHGTRAPAPSRRSAVPGRPRTGLKVRRVARGVDDGYRSELIPGLKSSTDAELLAEELAFAATRLVQLALDPPGLYAEVADTAGDLEERSWLAFLIAYFGPLDGDEPFAMIELARTSWRSGAAPELEGIEAGPRGSHQPGQGTRTIDAYRAWAARAGSQAAAFTRDVAWTPQRRFARVFERLALPGLQRGGRFDLLATLGRLGVYELQAGALGLGGTDSVTLAAKRLLGIGDPTLLERRAADLAEACGVPLEAIDVGFFNWERRARAQLGMPVWLEPDPAVLETARSALGI